MTEEGRGLPGGLGMKCGNPVGEGLLESQNWERIIFSITSLTRIGQRARAAVLRTNEGTDAAHVPVYGSTFRVHCPLLSVSLKLTTKYLLRI